MSIDYFLHHRTNVFNAILLKKGFCPIYKTCCFFIFSNYEIKKSEKVCAMFDSFNNYLGEETLWQISEEIKPRGGKKKEAD